MVDSTFVVTILAKIVLSDGTEIELKSNRVGEVKGINYITGLNVSRSLSASSNNPIGVPCSANGTLTLVSTDLSMMPENVDSPYAGKMDNKAVIYLTLEDDEGQVVFGTYYVEDWYSDISSDKLTEVNIEFSGIMSYLNKSPAPNLNIERNASIKQYLVSIVEKWNESVEDKYKLTIDESKLTFGPFETMPYSDIDASDYGKILTVLSQSTLTNFYIGNSNEILTDYYFDDSGSDSVCNITDCTNAYQYNIGEGLLVKYKGVKVNYSNAIVNDSTCLVSLKGQTLLASSDTMISNIDLGGKLYKLNYIQVECESQSVDVEIVSIEYNKRYVSILLRNPLSTDIAVSIQIYGQNLNNSNMAITKGNEPMLELTNGILSKADCEIFTDSINSIINKRGDQLKITGYFNPRINLGDIVYVNLKAVNKTGYYKVHDISTSIKNSIQTTLNLYSLNDNTKGE